jgi:hypothetical protein
MKFRVPSSVFSPLLTFAVFAVGVLVASSFVAPPQRGTEHSTGAQKSTKEDVKHGFWEKTADDPVAYFTLWMVAFTGVLAVSTVGLGIATVFLWRAGEKQIAVARDAANAATRQARAAESALFAVEIPYLYIVVKSHAVTVENYAIKKIGTMNAEGIVIDEGYDFSDVITFCFDNVGRTPAEIIEFSATIRFEEWPPAPVIPAREPSRWATEVVPAHGRSKERGSAFGTDLLLGGGMNREKEALWFKGYVRYADVFKNEYIYGFCFGFDTFANNGTAGEFYATGGDDHNYRKKVKTGIQRAEPPESL